MKKCPKKNLDQSWSYKEGIYNGDNGLAFNDNNEEYLNLNEGDDSNTNKQYHSLHETCWTR